MKLLIMHIPPISRHYMHICVCACVRACVRGCVCVCVDFILLPDFPISFIKEHWIMEKPMEIM
jgi:hypothetical protein